jgi:hypothetical protein
MLRPPTLAAPLCGAAFAFFALIVPLVLDRKVGDAIHELGTPGITDFGSRGLHSRMNLYAAFGVGSRVTRHPRMGAAQQPKLLYRNRLKAKRIADLGLLPSKPAGTLPSVEPMSCVHQYLGRDSERRIPVG